MSWSITRIGRAGKLATTIKNTFETQGGCPAGTAEEAAKNAAGAMLQGLCEAFIDPATVIKIDANGSAWHEGGKAKSQSLTIKLETIHGFEE